MARENDVVGPAGADEGEEDDRRPGGQGRQRGEHAQGRDDHGCKSEDETLAHVQPSLQGAEHEVRDDQRGRHHQERVAGLHRLEPVPVRKVGPAQRPRTVMTTG